MAPPAKPSKRSRRPGCSPRRLPSAWEDADVNGHPPRSWREVIRLARLRSLDAERALERGKILGQRRDRTFESIAVRIAQLLVALETAVLRLYLARRVSTLAKFSRRRALS